MTAQPRPLSIAAMTADFVADPTLAVEVVTGARQQPDDLDWLYGSSLDLVKDDDDLIDMGLLPTDGAIGIYKRIAARDALAILANREDEEREAETRLLEDGPSVRAAR